MGIQTNAHDFPHVEGSRPLLAGGATVVEILPMSTVLARAPVYL